MDLPKNPRQDKPRHDNHHFTSEVLKREEFGEFPEFQKEAEVVERIELPPLDGPEEADETKKREAYYLFRQLFVIELRDLKIYPKVASHLMRSSDVSLYNVEFSATNRKEVVDRLRKAAFADAKRAAQETAETSGESLGRVHSVSEMPLSDLGDLIGEDDSGSVMYSMAGDADPVYEVPPQVSESFSIIVLFQLDQAAKTTGEQPGAENPATRKETEPEGPSR